ncbi:MAG TPA: helix-turn-helix domain-containing protein [Candidatus Acidoferrales bacterium]|nr:helix-turn-helix domain-containing protein [Candidatus Acidoferrales bacterium]
MRRRTVAGRGDAQRTRERLIDAAAELFNTVGYAGTDSNRIARAAGYAPAMFYKHFDDKREIFLAAYSRWVTSELNGIREISSRAKGRPAVSRITRRVLEHHRRWAGFRRSLRALSLSDEQVRDFRLEQRVAQLEVLQKLTRVKPTRRSDQVFMLLVFERICDAIADGEAKALGAREGELVQRLEELVAAVRP